MSESRPATNKANIKFCMRLLESIEDSLGGRQVLTDCSLDKIRYSRKVIFQILPVFIAR